VELISSYERKDGDEPSDGGDENDGTLNVSGGLMFFDSF
jgi:hypothetical protein